MMFSVEHYRSIEVLYMGWLATLTNNWYINLIVA